MGPVVPGNRAEVRLIHPDVAAAAAAAAAEEEDDWASPSQPASPETASMPGEGEKQRGNGTQSMDQVSESRVELCPKSLMTQNTPDPYNSVSQ